MVLSMGSAHVEADKHHVGHDNRNQCIFQKEVGPARTGILPSRGSSNPSKDQNMDDATTGPGAPASPFPGYHDAFQRLESPIDRVLGFAKTQAKLAEIYSDFADRDEQEALASIICFIANETLAATSALESQWIASHNAGCDAQYRETWG